MQNQHWQTFFTAGLLLYLAVNATSCAAAELRKLEGKHLTLWTDLPSSPEVNRLPEYFDQAYPQYCAFFGVDPEKHDDWHMTGYLMKDKNLFVRKGLLPHGLPKFKHGFTAGRRLWVYDQPSDYYRRHLLLHEGVHGFCLALFNWCGPPWFMEGLAELLATHRLENGKVVLKSFPADRASVPMWGRIKLVQDAFHDKKALTFDRVLAFGPSAHLDTTAYAWSWAAAVLLDVHPGYRAAFRRAIEDFKKGDDPTERLKKELRDDWPALCEEWKAFVQTLEYGHDIAKGAIDFTPGAPLADRPREAIVEAKRGWQNSGIRLTGGRPVILSASGRFTIAQTDAPWPCEPGGVTLRYYQGRPLGILLAAIVPDDPSEKPNAFLFPYVIGLGATVRPEVAGTLFFKLNDSAGELEENEGEVTVTVRRP